MRLAPFLCLLVAAAAAGQEAEAPPEPSPYAAMGFPVTFNDEIITANDVARYLGQKLEEIELVALARTRDILIFRKINQRIAADLALQVREEDVDRTLKSQIEAKGGDAKFYEWLAQQGTTLESYRIELYQNYVESLLGFLLINGFSHDRSQLLPWRIQPTPKEVETAFRNDPQLKGGSLRARRLVMTVDVLPEVRSRIGGQQVRRQITAEQAAAAIEEAVQPRLQAALEALKTRPFAEVAAEYGARGLDAMAKEWVALDGASETEKFLASAGVNTWSEPRKLPGGRYEIVFLLERDNPAERKAGDPAVAEEFNKRIKSLRMTKCQALLRLKALDGSTVAPDRVREELRKQILDTLSEAEVTLNSLGLH